MSNLERFPTTNEVDAIDILWNAHHGVRGLVDDEVRVNVWRSVKAVITAAFGGHLGAVHECLDALDASGGDAKRAVDQALGKFASFGRFHG